jgi:hypothetical protein
MLQARVQRLVDLGRFGETVELCTRAIWSANQGALSLILQPHEAKDVRTVSKLLFDAVVAQLSREK